LYQILLISDDIDEIKRVYRLCSDNGYIFYFFNNASASLEFLLNENIDVVIVRQEYVDDPVRFLDSIRDNNLIHLIFLLETAIVVR